MPARHLRIALIAAGLLMTTNGPLLFFAGRVIDRPGFPPPWEDAVVRPILLVFALLTALFVLNDLRSGFLRGRLQPNRLVAFAVVVFPLLAVASSLWGERPELTFWRSLVYCGLAFLAVAIAVLDDPSLVWVMGVVTALAVGASIIVVVAWPNAGLNSDNFWRGIYTNPNSLGPIAALGVLAGVGLWNVRRTPATRTLAVAIAGGSAIALYQSTSRTSWFALVIAIGVATAVVGTRALTNRVGPRQARFIAGPLVSAGAAITVAVFWLRWDDPTFAQRRTIWRGSWGYIEDRLLQGHGFFSFFEVPGRATAKAYFDRGSAHSSFVEVFLGLGVLGLSLFLVIVVAAVVNTTRETWRQPTALSWMRLALVIFLVFENLTESFILWFSYNWVILCAAALRRPSSRPSRLERNQSSSTNTVTLPSSNDSATPVTSGAPKRTE